MTVLSRAVALLAVLAVTAGCGPVDVLPEDDRVLEVGSTLTAEIARDGGRRAHPVIGVEGQTLVIDVEATSEGFDTFLRIYGPDGALVTSDDDGGSGLNSQAVLVVDDTGRYVAEVGSYQDGDRGTYRLSVRLQGEPDPIGGDDDQFEGDVVVDGTGEVGRDGTEANRFAFKATAGAAVRIDVLTPDSDLDPVVDVLGPRGSIVASDDDGGDGLDARTVFTVAESGTHVAVVEGFGGSRGAYRVVVRVAEPPLGQLEPAPTPSGGGLRPSE